MRRIGDVARVRKGTIVARSPDDGYPEIGVEVVDERLDVVGRVVDVMGSVERPYVVITAREENAPASLLNEPLYARS